MNTTSSAGPAHWWARATWAGSAVINGLALVAFLAWLLRTDLLFGHFKGPPTWLFWAVALAAAGLGASAIGAVTALVSWLRRPTGVPAGAGRWISRLVGVLGLAGLTFLSSLIVLISFEELPKARKAQHRQHVENLWSRGPAAVPELLQALHDDDWITRQNAVEALGKVGPGAKDAAPALVAILEGEDPLNEPSKALAWFALKKIDPAAAEKAGRPKGRGGQQK